MPPQNPGPILRIREGVPAEVTLHNKLPVQAVVFGFYQHSGDAAKNRLEIGPGETKAVTFVPGPPGAYLYFANTEGGEFSRNDVDSQLNGVIVVDPGGQACSPRSHSGDQRLVQAWARPEETGRWST